MTDAGINDLIRDFSWESAQASWPRMVAALAQGRLQWHPLGFLHATLVDSVETALRLHIWKPGMRHVQDPAWLIHTHVFDLRSIVLVGRLENRIHKWIPDLDHPVSRLYEISYNGYTSSLVATNRFGVCECESSLDVTRGIEYAVSYGQFHETEIAKTEFTITVALATKRSGAPLVVGAVDAKPSYSYPRRELTGNAKDQLIHEVNRLIDV